MLLLSFKLAKFAWLECYFDLFYYFLIFIKHVSRGTLAKVEKFRIKKNEPIWLVFTTNFLTTDTVSVWYGTVKRVRIQLRYLDLNRYT